MAGKRRSRLVIQAATGAFAVLWDRAVAKVTRRAPAPAVDHVIHRFDTFVTWHDRPKTVLPGVSRDARAGFASTAIVVQGQVIEKSDFTVETVRTYRTLFPDAPVIVSTWSDSDPQTLARIVDAGGRVVLSDPPLNPGNHNQNMQLVSARAGVVAARDSGAEFVVKSRTDQRMYSPTSLPMMHALLEAFPLREPAPGQRSRIVTSDQYTYTYVLYGAGDQLNFGRVEDMLTYWSAPFDDADPDRVGSMPAGTAREMSVRRLHEGHFGAAFLEATGWELQWTLRDWWRALAERFVVFDATSVDRYWPKYTLREYPHRTYTGSTAFDLMHFADWIVLANDPEMMRIDVPEWRLDEPLSV